MLDARLLNDALSTLLFGLEKHVDRALCGTNAKKNMLPFLVINCFYQFSLAENKPRFWIAGQLCPQLASLHLTS